jgi:hypothetical protein
VISIQSVKNKKKCFLKKKQRKSGKTKKKKIRKKKVMNMPSVK